METDEQIQELAAAGYVEQAMISRTDVRTVGVGRGDVAVRRRSSYRHVYAIAVRMM